MNIFIATFHSHILNVVQTWCFEPSYQNMNLTSADLGILHLSPLPEPLWWRIFLYFLTRLPGIVLS